MTVKELIKRYKAGERNFQGANLRGSYFREARDIYSPRFSIMPIGEALINEFDLTEFDKYCPGVNGELLNLLVSWINMGMKDRTGEWFIFLYPTLDNYAKELDVPFKEVYATFLSLNKLRPEKISQKAVFENSELHYVLNEFDIEDVNNKNELHHPDNPDIVYSNARELIRSAFVINR